MDTTYCTIETGRIPEATLIPNNDTQINDRKKFKFTGILFAVLSTIIIFIHLILHTTHNKSICDVVNGYLFLLAMFGYNMSILFLIISGM
jgi:hypothetical protein